MVDLQYQIGLRTGARAGPLDPILERVANPGLFAAICAYAAVLSAGGWALAHVAPDTLAFRMFGHALAVHHLHARVIDDALVAALILPAVFLVEYLCVGWEACSARDLLVRRSGSIWSDVACFAVSLTPLMTVAMTLTSFGVVLISSEAAKTWLAHATGYAPNIAREPLALQVVLLFVVYSFFDYWSHWLDHTKVFWPLHRFHHAAESFSVLTAARTHPAVFTALIGLTAPGILVSASPEALVDLNLFVIALRLLIHSRIDSDFGWIGRWCLQSPRHHRQHHSRHVEDHGLHLSMFPLWDRLFGTWGDWAEPHGRIGVETPYRHGAWIGPDMWRDYRDFWSGLIRLRWPAKT